MLKKVDAFIEQEHSVANLYQMLQSNNEKIKSTTLNLSDVQKRRLKTINKRAKRLIRAHNRGDSMEEKIKNYRTVLLEIETSKAKAM